VLSKHDVVEPDLLYVASDQSGILTEKNIQGPPALIVEVLSPSTRRRDVQTKRRLFERTGVREYWLVAELSADGDESLTTPLLPGCVVALRNDPTSEAAPSGVGRVDQCRRSTQVVTSTVFSVSSCDMPSTARPSNRPP